MLAGGFSPAITVAEDWVIVIRAQSEMGIPPEPIGEEVDIFRERAMEKSRLQRREAKQRKKGKAPPHHEKLFFYVGTE